MACRNMILAAILGGLLAGSLLADPPAPARSINAIPNNKASSDLIEFLSRKSALRSDEITGRLDLARWARDREMWTQAADLAREALDRDPDNRSAWTVLQQVDQAIPLAAEPQVETALIKEFNDRFKRNPEAVGGPSASFKTRNSRHFLLCYDTTDTFAAQRGASLEKAYDAFMFFFNMQKLRPAFLEKRLVVILFKERADYLVYAKATEGADLSWAAGYYSQRINRSVFFDDSSSPQSETVDKELAKLRAMLKDINNQIKSANDRHMPGLASSLSAERERLSQTLFQLTTQVDNATTLANAVKTVHEAAHQLAFNTGIQKRLVDYPLWFSEGLACSFEIEDHNGQRGPALLNNGRIAVLKEAIKRNQFIPLEKFITEPIPPTMDERTLSIFYAEGWGLFHFLYKTNRAGMEKYLLAHQSLPIARQAPADQRLKLFTDAFTDDLPALEKKFTTYLKDLPPKQSP